MYEQQGLRAIRIFAYAEALPRLIHLNVCRFPIALNAVIWTKKRG
jgi:hypothetical protein